MMTTRGTATPMPALAPVERPELDWGLLFSVEGPVALLPALELLLEVGGFIDDVPGERQTNVPWMIPLVLSF
jgi:hypothetical protein